MPRNRTVRTTVLGVSARRPAAGKASSRTSAALRRRLVVGALVFFSLVLVTLSFGRDDGPLSGVQNGVAGVLRPFQVATDRLVTPFRDAWGWFDGLLDARSDAERLRKENQRYAQQLVMAQNALSENKKLRDLLDYRSAASFPDDYRGLGAAVIQRPTGAYAQSIVVAVGSDDGVRVGDPVVTERGLVGRVIRTAGRSSRVMLLTDEQSAASAVDVATDGQGIIRRGQSPRSALRFDRVPKEQVVRTGDTIATSGWRTAQLSSLYPKGIPIGTVTSVGQNDTYPFKQVQVEPFVDFGSLSAVLVLVPRVREEPFP
ncbi:MAG: rod shape-determining protein MreC [Gaiellales bacterium]